MTNPPTIPPSTPPTTPPRAGRRPHRSRRSGSGLFRAAWRWHFFAAFLVVPVLLVLSVTGLVYLFRFQLEPLLHPDLMRVEVPAEATLAGGAVTAGKTAGLQLEQVSAAYPDATVVSMTEPLEPDHSTRFSLVLEDGSVRDAFVDPWTGEVLGSLDPDTTVSGYAVRLHGELMSGRLGDAVIELAACWAIVMAITGYYLFFRGRRARQRALRAGRRDVRLRHRHGTVGLVAGVGLLFLLVSGLPWTGVWGAKVQELATAQGSSLWSLDHGAVSEPTSRLDESLPHTHVQELPWALGGTEVPRSDPAGQGTSVANIDTAIAAADAEGLRHPFTVALPSPDLEDPGVYSVIGYAFDAPSDERTVHVDRYGGQVVSTYGFDDYPTLAQVVSQGIGLHEGRSLGLWSFWGAAAMCLAIIVMCLTGPLMWWRRRPRGVSRIGAPRGRMPLRSSPLLALAVVALGLLLPLFGLSLLVVLALDQGVLRRVPALSGWFDTVQA